VGVGEGAQVEHGRTCGLPSLLQGTYTHFQFLCMCMCVCEGERGKYINILESDVRLGGGGVRTYREAYPTSHLPGSQVRNYIT